MLELEDQLRHYGEALEHDLLEDSDSKLRSTAVTRRPWRRILAVAAAVAVLTGGAVAILVDTTDDQDSVVTADIAEPTDAGRAEPEGVPSPLFGEVEQLVPDSLPDGWSRCGGGPATHPGATDEWWSQTFGPTTDDGCRPLITVTQVPLGGQGSFDAPSDAEDAKIAGDADASRWFDPDTGSVGLVTWAFDQNLLVEGCCGPEVLEHFDEVAGAALIGTRDQAPPNCTDPASDLSAESLIENLTAKTSRMFDGDGCPIRSDLASMETLPDDHHCWPGLTMLSIGTPIGASTHDTEPRTYVRDPTGQLSGGVPDPALDLDADLSETATQGGYTHDGRTVWVDETNDSTVLVVSGDTVEAWPRHEPLGLGCA